MKSKRVKWILIVVVILIVLGLALPISNLIIGVPENALSRARFDDPLLATVCAILAEKCVNCHTEEYQLPLYAQLPIAKQMIEYDVAVGTRYINLAEALLPANEKPVPEAALAKLQYTTARNTMPPGRYLLMHWDGALSAAETKALLDWIRQTRRKHYVTAGVAPQFQDEIVQPLGQSFEVDAKRVALGNKLFHDTRLSKDDSMSCASCHALDKGGTDQKQFSDGVGGARGDINAPTVYNAAYQFLQFWDGREPNLEEQAKGPVANPVEMAATWPDVIEKLKKDAALVAEFAAAGYTDSITQDNVVSAIADFERTLITPNSRFDKYLTGQIDAISAEEKQGYELFKEHECANCHVGKILGGQSFELMGRAKNYFADRGNATKPDMGRFNVTELEKDRYRFKVPTLRNITVTFPYLHEGSTTDLAKIVNIMAEYQSGVKLAPEKTALIVGFLKTLTGEYQGKLLQ